MRPSITAFVIKPAAIYTEATGRFHSSAASQCLLSNAPNLGHAEFKAGLVIAEIITDHLTLPVLKEVASMLSGAAGAEVVNYRCHIRELAGGICPRIPARISTGSVASQMMSMRPPPGFYLPILMRPVAPNRWLFSSNRTSREQSPVRVRMCPPNEIYKLSGSPKNI